MQIPRYTNMHKRDIFTAFFALACVVSAIPIANTG